MKIFKNRPLAELEAEAKIRQKELNKSAEKITSLKKQLSELRQEQRRAVEKLRTVTHWIVSQKRKL